MLVVTFLTVAIAIAAPQSPSTTPEPATHVDAGHGEPPTDQSISATKSDVEVIYSTLVEIQDSMNGLKKSTWVRDWSPVLASVVTAFIAIWSIGRTTNTSLRTVRETIADKAREEERKAIRQQIDNFYGPFIQLRSTSKAIYHQAFIPRRTEQERASYADANGNFRPLLALLKGHKFEATDSTLLKLIIEIGQKAADLILDKVGLVDEASLQQTLARATTHFRLMQIAFNAPADFVGSGSEFESFTFPAELDDLVQAKLDALNARLQALSSAATPSP